MIFRPLSSSELFFYYVEKRGGYGTLYQSYRYKNAVDPEILRNIIKRVMDKWPVLRCSVAGGMLREVDGPLPLCIQDRSDDDWPRGQPVRWQAPYSWGVDLCLDGEIRFFCHHSLMDGLSFGEIVHHIIMELGTDGHIDSVLSFPVVNPSMENAMVQLEQMLPRHIAPTTSDQLVRFRPDLSIHAKTDSTLVDVKFPNIVGICKRKKVRPEVLVAATVNRIFAAEHALGLLCGSLLSVKIPITMRGYLDPKIVDRRNHVGVYVGTHNTLVPLSDDVERLVREYSDCIGESQYDHWPYHRVAERSDWDLKRYEAKIPWGQIPDQSTNIQVSINIFPPKKTVSDRFWSVKKGVTFDGCYRWEFKLHCHLHDDGLSIFVNSCLPNSVPEGHWAQMLKQNLEILGQSLQ